MSEDPKNGLVLTGLYLEGASCASKIQREYHNKNRFSRNEYWSIGKRKLSFKQHLIFGLTLICLYKLPAEKQLSSINRPFSKMAPADGGLETGGMAWDRNRKLQLKIVSSLKAKIVKYAESWLKKKKEREKGDKINTFLKDI